MNSEWKCRTGEAVEKQTPLSHRSHSPWKSQGDSHIPTRRRLSSSHPLQPKNQNPNRLRYLHFERPGRLESVTYPAFR